MSAIFLLILWLVWFFWAPLIVYETGEVVGSTRDGTLLANFSADSSTRLQPGQSATVRAQTGAVRGADDKTLPAMVMLVDSSGIGNSGIGNAVMVELAALSDRWLDVDDLTNVAGRLVVEVEVGRISPAMWVLNVSGQWIEAPSVLLRPQPRLNDNN